MQPILDYFIQTALLTLQQFAIVLGPVLMLAFILDRLSRFVRGRAAAIFGLNAYAYLTAPGVMVHELGHAFFCVLFLHRITRMRLFSPASDGSLGSVSHSWNPRSPYQTIGNFFIGTGPIWFGTTIVCLLAWYLLGSAAGDAVRDLATSSNGTTRAAMASQVGALAWQLFVSLLRPSLVSTWQFWIFGYLMFCIGSHITLSRPDIKGAAGGFASLVTLLLLFNLLTSSLSGQFFLRACRVVMQGAVVFYAAMSLVTCLNFALATVLFVLSLAMKAVR